MPNPIDHGEVEARQQVSSPFSNERTAPASEARLSSNLALKIGLGVALAIIVCGAGFWAITQAQDPLRTMSEFSTDQYYSDYHSVIGAKFKARLRVDAELEMKDGKGRLMVFTVEGASRTIAVLVQGDTNFLKDQIYTGELYVSEGGLIHATNLKKD